MLKAWATGKDGRPLLMFGLSYGNLDKLRDGKPIIVNGKEMGVDVDVLIFAEPTEMDMARKLEKYIGPNTEVHIDPKLRS